jgi:hypothetical protein
LIISGKKHPNNHKRPPKTIPSNKRSTQEQQGFSVKITLCMMTNQYSGHREVPQIVQDISNVFIHDQPGVQAKTEEQE